MDPLSRMKLLINLAKVDGQVGDNEKNYLVNIGRANGIYPDELYPLFTQHHEVFVPSNLSEDEKFELLVTLVQLMKLDERMYREEIAFCAQAAARLGYNRQALFELLAHVKSGKMEESELATLKKVTQNYLSPRLR